MLAQEITRLRETKGWTMSELARHLSVHVDLIVDWESETRFPTKKHHLALVELANASGPLEFDGKPSHR